jgi:hypothetical protein
MGTLTHTVTPTTDISHAAAKEPTRYAMQGAKVVPSKDGDGYLVATDGRMLAIAPARVEKHEPSAVDPIIPATLLKGNVRRVQCNGDIRTEYHGRKADAVGAPLTDAFPSAPDVFPDTEAGTWEWVAFDAALLARLALAIGAADGVRVGIRTDRCSPLVVLPVNSEGADGAMGLLMPISGGDTTREGRAKSWFGTWRQRVAAFSEAWKSVKSAPVA